MDDSQRYLKAKEKVENLKSFYSHLIIYVLINGMLFVLNMLTSPDNLWFLYPLGGWGIGLIIHGLSISNWSFFSDEWEEKKIKAFMEKDKHK